MTDKKTQQDKDSPHIVTDPETGEKTHYLGQAQMKLAPNIEKKPEPK